MVVAKAKEERGREDGRGVVSAGRKGLMICRRTDWKKKKIIINGK